MRTEAEIRGRIHEMKWEIHELRKDVAKVNTQKEPLDDTDRLFLQGSLRTIVHNEGMVRLLDWVLEG